MDWIASPKVWITAAAIAGVLLGGVPGLVIGAIGGLIATILIGLALNLTAGGVLPRNVRRDLVTNVLTDSPQVVKRAFPNKSGTELFRALEAEAERIVRKAVAISPSHQEIYTEPVITKAGTQLYFEEADPSKKELVRVIFERMQLDWYHRR